VLCIFRVIDITNGHFINASPLEGTGVSTTVVYFDYYAANSMGVSKCISYKEKRKAKGESQYGQRMQASN
jgi:hypothetical protein